MKGQTAEETQVVGVHFVMDGFSLQADDVPDVDQTIENAIDENWILGYVPKTCQNRHGAIKDWAISGGDATITRSVIVPVPSRLLVTQNETVNHVGLERVGLLLECATHMLL